MKKAHLFMSVGTEVCSHRLQNPRKVGYENPQSGASMEQGRGSSQVKPKIPYTGPCQQFLFLVNESEAKPRVPTDYSHLPFLEGVFWM